jgi:hypothetical protein
MSMVAGLLAAKSLPGQNPHELLAPYVREGMTVLEPGPGMRSFTLELACLVDRPVTWSQLTYFQR